MNVATRLLHEITQFDRYERGSLGSGESKTTGLARPQAY
jgi:hypothetical protein